MKSTCSKSTINEVLKVVSNKKLRFFLMEVSGVSG